jgi:hypothetical protein
MRVLIASALALLGAGAVVAAQSATVRQETRIEVKDGEDVVVTGCVARTASGEGFSLTHVESKNGDEHVSRAYLLVGESDELEDHVGHLVEIEGKATDVDDDGEIEVTTKTKIERDDADDKETESRTRIEGDLDGIPYLGVDKVKMVRASCV